MSEIRGQINEFFIRLSETIDISDTQYEQAKDRYMAIAKWLQRDGSLVAPASPDIFPQGSFRLGTMVKPFSEEDKFDIDLVSSLKISKNQITQKKLKEAIGYEIKEYARANNMKSLPEEGKRCWTLKYSDGAQFSMDTLPSVPDAEGFQKFLNSRGLMADWTGHAIAITDTTHENYEIIATDWLRSNPIGYAEWFKTRMTIQFNESRMHIANAMAKGNIDKVPEYKIKTPLQRAIQILKRHRDIMFADDPDDKPISIIITTLAGHAYNNEANLVDTLLNIVKGMPHYIIIEDGVSKVRNPVDPTENFADKWHDHPLREEKFKEWLTKVHFDIKKALQYGSIHEAGEFLRPRLGERAVNESLTHLTRRLLPGLTSGTSLVRSSSHTPAPFNVPHKQPLRWPWHPNPNTWASITGKYRRNGFREQIFESETVLPKGCSLSFYASTNIRWPFKVYWQVVNTGHEAKYANSLRGGYYEGIIQDGGKKRHESTSYTGMHWVECFIVKGGECIARSGEFIINIKEIA